MKFPLMILHNSEFEVLIHVLMIWQINLNFSASVNEAMTLYTVPISNGERSSFRQTGSQLGSSDAMTRHSDRVVHDQCTEAQQPMRRDFDWCTIMLSQ